MQAFAFLFDDTVGHSNKLKSVFSTSSYFRISFNAMAILRKQEAVPTVSFTEV